MTAQQDPKVSQLQAEFKELLNEEELVAIERLNRGEYAGKSRGRPRRSHQELLGYLEGIYDCGYTENIVQAAITNCRKAQGAG